MQAVSQTKGYVALASIYIKMSETFNKVLVKDDRIGNISDAVKYAVFKGGQNITSMSYQAIFVSPRVQYGRSIP